MAEFVPEPAARVERPPQDRARRRADGARTNALSRAARDAQERVCRYLLFAPLAVARLTMSDDDTLLYQLKRPDQRGRTALVLTPHELIGGLCALLPAPRFPLRRAFGVFGVGRTAAKARHPRTRTALHAPPSRRPTAATDVVIPVGLGTLLRRTFGFSGLECTTCGGPMKPIPAIEDPDETRRYLTHLGLPTELPRAACARAPHA